MPIKKKGLGKGLDSLIPDNKSMKSVTSEKTVESKEDDFFFDEIGSVLKIKQLRAEKRELLENMETYFRVFFLQEGQDVISD